MSRLEQYARLRRSGLDPVAAMLGAGYGDAKARGMGRVWDGVARKEGYDVDGEGMDPPTTQAPDTDPGVDVAAPIEVEAPDTDPGAEEVARSIWVEAPDDDDAFDPTSYESKAAAVAAYLEQHPDAGADNVAAACDCSAPYARRLMRSEGT